MPGIARGRQDARRDPRQIGQPFHSDPKSAAPCVVDLYIAKMREDLAHGAAHLGGNIAGKAVAIALAAAKQQPLVMAEAEVIHHKFAVRHRHITGQNLRGGIAQRLGCGDKIVDRHHPCGDLFVQAAKIAITGEDQMIGAHGALAGAHLDLRAALDGKDFAAFINLRACGSCCMGQTEGKIQRMQMPGTMVQNAPLIGG